MSISSRTYKAVEVRSILVSRHLEVSEIEGFVRPYAQQQDQELHVQLSALTPNKSFAKNPTHRLAGYTWRDCGTANDRTFRLGGSF